MIKVIIFDLDDTLYSEIDFIKSGFTAVSQYAAFHFKIPKETFYEKIVSRLKRFGRGKIFDAVLAEFNLFSKKRVALLVRCYRRHTPRIVLYPEVRSVLLKLKRNYGLGIITDGMGRVQKKKVKALKLERLFDFIIYTHIHGIEKPSPYSFRRMLSYFKIRPKEAVYIGDNPHKDFIGARKVGLKTIRIMRGKFKHIHIGRQYEADIKISHLKNLEKLLRVIK